MVVEKRAWFLAIYERTPEIDSAGVLLPIQAKSPVLITNPQLIYSSGVLKSFLVGKRRVVVVSRKFVQLCEVEKNFRITWK